MVNFCFGIELKFFILIILVLLYGVVVLFVIFGNVVFFWVIYKVCIIRIFFNFLLSLLLMVDFLVGLFIDLLWIVRCVLLWCLYYNLFKIVIDLLWI